MTIYPAEATKPLSAAKLEQIRRLVRLDYGPAARDVSIDPLSNLVSVTIATATGERRITKLWSRRLELLCDLE